MWRFNAGPYFLKRGLLCMVLRGDWIIYFTDLLLLLLYLVFVIMKSDRERKIGKLQCLLNTCRAQLCKYRGLINKTHFHYLISCCLGSDLNMIWSWHWCWDAELRKVVNLPTYGVLCAICGTKGEYAENFIVSTWVLYSLCLNKGVKAEHLIGADTMGNFMSLETTQQISW